MLAELSDHDKDAVRLNYIMARKGDKMIREIFEKSDAELNIAQIVYKYGYPFERFFVETKDGWLLQLHRISGGVGADPKQV